MPVLNRLLAYEYPNIERVYRTKIVKKKSRQNYLTPITIYVFHFIVNYYIFQNSYRFRLER